MKNFLEKYVVYFIAFLMLVLMCKIYALDSKVDEINKNTTNTNNILTDPNFTSITNE